METSLPAFIEIPELEQASEIRQYLKSAGAELSSDCKENLHEELSSLLDACDNWLRSASDAEFVSGLHRDLQIHEWLYAQGLYKESCINQIEIDLEAMMNSFISLILMSTFDGDKLTQKFCSKLTDVGASENNAKLRIKILNNFFTGLDDKSPLKWNIYYSQLKLASKFGLTDKIETQLKQVKEWFETWNIDVDKKRKSYRLLHDALKDEKRSDEATKVMLELLATYDEKSASEAKEDAEQCILNFISKPDVFIMDHLLQLRPVSALEGQPLHQLLKIFVSGSLHDYLTLYGKNSNFVDSLPGINHENNIRKMRFLTFLSITSQQNEIEYSSLAKQLDLNEDDIEEFVIDVIKTKMVYAKLDQVNEKVLLSTAFRRTFERKEWEQVRDKLESWKENLQVIRGQLEQIVPSV